MRPAINIPMYVFLLLHRLGIGVSFLPFSGSDRSPAERAVRLGDVTAYGSRGCAASYAGISGADDKIAVLLLLPRLLEQGCHRVGGSTQSHSGVASGPAPWRPWTRAAAQLPGLSSNRYSAFDSTASRLNESGKYS